MFLEDVSVVVRGEEAILAASLDSFERGHLEHHVETGSSVGCCRSGLLERSLSTLHAKLIFLMT